MQRVLSKVFGTRNDREIKKIRPIVERINALEPEFEALSDDALRGKTAEYRGRLEAGETTNDLLPEAFATVREGAKRTLGQRHYDVQLIGGIFLHEGSIAEMKTGEGKTLVCDAALVPERAHGQGRPRRHRQRLSRAAAMPSGWGEVHRFLGLTVGNIVHGLERPRSARKRTSSDITYATNNELGFDYLRDNMKLSARPRWSRGRCTTRSSTRSTRSWSTRRARR